MKKAEEYNPIAEGSGREAIDEVRNELLRPLERDIDKLRDPVVLASLMHTAATERENTNRLLKTLIEKLDMKFGEIEERLDRMERGATTQAGAEEPQLLSGLHEGILAFVKEKRHVSTEEVRRRFSYKGKNAASAHLNKMFEMGLLGKKQVGRSVLYFAKL